MMGAFFMTNKKRHFDKNFLFLSAKINRNTI